MTLLVSYAVSRARAGDGDAFEFLYARYADDVYGYIRGIVGDRHEAEDLTRRVFVELMRRIGSYEEQDTFLAWMLRLARGGSLSHGPDGPRTQAGPVRP